ncbi:MAG: hypothetical protein QF662_05915, partial [Phycisphaerae bacterium]|nr:hypothetical protein [Phycisphaerae bacterium]
MATIECECGAALEISDEQDASAVVCPNCGKSVPLDGAASRSEVAEDFLSSLEKGHVSVSHGKEKEAVPETAPAITVEGMPASSGRRRGPTPLQTRKQMQALHLTFKKVAFWPVVAMAVAMFVVASMSIKSIVSTRSLVP